MKIVVLDGHTLCQQDLDFDALRPFGEVTVYDRTSSQETIERIGDAQIVITNKVLITREVMRACPAMRYVGVTATGYNIIDLDAAREHGVTVTNVPAYSTMAVVQHTMALLLHHMSRVSAYDAQVKAGEWVRSPYFCLYGAPMQEVCGMTLGVIGYGSIGRATARAAAALGMDVLVYTAHPSEDRRQEGMRFAALDELLARSDVITLHCPLTGETKGLIGSENIEKMKPGAVVINTARGPIVDSAAMAAALHEGRIACYMADVLDTEPPAADDPLLSSPNAVITPHVAWAAYQTRKRLMGVVVANVKAYLDGAPVNVVSR